MGVLNVTPDSFSDGGQFLSVDAALTRTEQMLKEGAALVDVGGESTRPGSLGVSADEECRRVVPVISAIVRSFPQALVSVDTQKSKVAQEAIAAGACLVNDVSALGDAAMAEVVSRSQVGLCLMHRQGEPLSMQRNPHYDNVTESVLRALETACQRAEDAKVKRTAMLVDPGIGFGKTLEHNLTLLKELGEFRKLRCAVLLGISRKSFLGALLNGIAPHERVTAGVALSAVLASRGHVDVLRVHDVKATIEALTVVEALAS